MKSIFTILTIFAGLSVQASTYLCTGVDSGSITINTKSSSETNKPMAYVNDLEFRLFLNEEDGLLSLSINPEGAKPEEVLVVVANPGVISIRNAQVDIKCIQTK